jgi:hypothetical protein
MFGPIEGRRHDMFMLGISGLSDKLRQLTKPNGERYVIDGDLAMWLSLNILAPFCGAQLTKSKVRINVEWGFGKIGQNFAFLDFKKNLKVLLQPIGNYYTVASLLINCHTCLYGSLTSTYFNLNPPPSTPSLEKYMFNN